MPRSHNHLLEAMADPGQLHHAFRQAAQGKRYRTDASVMFFDLEGQLRRIREELLDGRYRFGTYCVFKVRDPKERVIKAAPFRDRVVHHALCNVIAPIFERSMIPHSYACRVGKGNLAAVRRLQGWVRGRPQDFALICDVRKYFDSIDHGVLLGLLSRRLSDRRLLDLLSALLVGGAASPGKGIPIGNLTSQLFANVYLDPFDHFVKETLRVRHYLRYVDDFVCLDSSKTALRQVLAAQEEKLAALGLGLDPRKVRLAPVSTGLPFLGFVVSPGRLRLRGSRLVRSRRLLRQRRDESERGHLSEDRYLATLESLVARAAQCDGRGLARRHGWA
jgi:retron-type reverse transcriptase